jgi:sugar lactone lactonase YvrE
MFKMTHAIFAVLLALIAICMWSIPASAIAAPPTAATEAATAVRYEEATLKGAVNPEGSATSYWFEYGKTEAYGTKIPVSPESIGSGTSNVAVNQTVTGLSQSTEYHFRVVAKNETETANGKDATFTTTGFNFSFGEEGSGNGQFKQPELGVATDSEGNIWVSDTGNNRIQEFNSKGEYLAKVGKEGTGNGEFKSPKGLAIDPSGNIWVVDSGNNRVQKFNPKGEYLLKFGEKGSGEGQFNSPAGMTFSGTNAFVVDSGNNRVQKFNLTFSPKFLAQFGKEGSGDGEFKSPTGVVVEGVIWTTDTGNNRIQKFNASTLKYGSKFGKEGTGSGEFNNPAGIDSDFQTRFWVVDPGNNRVEKFAHEGEYQDQVGKSGTGAGQLSNPTGVTTPAPQKLLILDTGNNRVQSWTVEAEPPTIGTTSANSLKTSSATLKSNIDPEALATTYWFEYGKTTSYGTKIPVSPESVGSGTSSVAVNQAVTGLAEGTTYHFRVVAESEAGTTQGIDTTLKTLRLPQAISEAPTDVLETQATLNAKVNPEGSATSYWFEYGKTTSYGTKIPVSPSSVGSGTSPAAVKQTPTSLSEGTEYHFRVLAESEAGMSKGGEDKTFTTLKLPDATTEAATAVKLTQATLNATVTPLGLETTYWFEYGETTSYGTKIPALPELIGSGGFPIAASQTATSLSEGTTYHYRVVAEAESGTRNGADKSFTTGPWFSFTFGNEGSSKGQFKHPAGIAIDAKGNLWVIDMENKRVEEFDKEGKYLFGFGEEGSGKCQFSRPAAIAIDSKGDVWITDAGNNRVEEFDEEGKCIIEFGEEGSKEGQFEGPEGIAIDAKGDIWVAETYNSRLQEFDEEGKLIEIIGSRGSEPGQLLDSAGIDIGPEGNIWVAEWSNHRVSEFNEAGEFVQLFGEKGSGNGQFAFPDAIHVDESGNVWVVDERNNRVQHFNEEGKYLGKFGTKGSGEGQFSFSYPIGIASDAEGSLWIADSLNNRVQKWIP